VVDTDTRAGDQCDIVGVESVATGRGVADECGAVAVTQHGVVRRHALVGGRESWKLSRVGAPWSENCGKAAPSRSCGAS
jgi:hypothetical protein